jgi:Protein of unknown function (DUF4238)
MAHCSTTVRMYIAIQFARTAGALAESRDMLSHVEKHAPPEIPSLDDADVITMSVQAAIAASPILDDLASCLIVNESNVNFFTSDHPVARINRFHTEARFPGGGGTGLAQAGLEVFFRYRPSTRSCCAIRTFTTSKAGPRSAVTIKRDDDARIVNDLQILTAAQNLYASHANEELERDGTKPRAVEWIDYERIAYWKGSRGNARALFS